MSESIVTAAELERVHALLPWLANGSLNAEDARWLRNWLTVHADDAPDIHAELAWLKRTSTQYNESIKMPDAERGLDSLLTRIHADKNVAAQLRRDAHAAHAEEKQGMFTWMKHMLSSPAFGLGVAAIALVQTGVIGVLLRTTPVVTPPSVSPSTHTPTQVQDLTPLSGTGGNVPQHAALLQITFMPNIKETDMRRALSEVGAQIVAGPSALGVYTIAVPLNEVDAALKHLQDNARTIESVHRP